MKSSQAKKRLIERKYSPRSSGWRRCQNQWAWVIRWSHKEARVARRGGLSPPPMMNRRSFASLGGKLSGEEMASICRAARMSLPTTASDARMTDAIGSHSRMIREAHHGTFGMANLSRSSA
ncbi:MAG: hypothetical protein IPM79_39280 [Polyangiaceae bacterium]|nr:hypothetical protein [Polyangiaceae bacterium]